MKKYKLLTLVGARPHFIKAAMVSKAIAQHSSLEEVIVHSGQHYDKALSGDFFVELSLPTPKYNLEVGSISPLSQLAQILIGLETIIEQEQPDLMIVYGDTNTTAAGAIAAAKCNIPLAHIEAGLREYDKSIPEEVNKLLTDAITDLYLCPSPTAINNLRKANITRGVYQVGDVGIDLVAHHLNAIKKNKDILTEYQLQPKEFYLLTCHRAANTNTAIPLHNILLAVSQLDYPVIFPIHPRTQKAIQQFDLQHFLNHPNIICIPPLSFLPLQVLLHHCKMVLTDSGGIIKEAYYHKVPAVIIDKQTEWIETIQEGWHQITGPDIEKILDAVTNFKLPDKHSGFLGDGQAAKRSIDIIVNYLNDRSF
jgi:UDP-GlcNAc3NAcA epimerase